MSRNTPGRAPGAQGTLNEIATADLVTALMGRYKEAVFIGCQPTDALLINGTPADRSSGPVLDVNTKLDKHTHLTSNLADILSRLLAGLKNKTAVPSQR